MKTRPNEPLAKPSITAPRVLPDRDVENAKDRGAKTRRRVTVEAPEPAGAIRC